MNNPGGEIRGQIVFTGKITLSTALNGAQEVPVVATPGTGTAVLMINLNTGSIGGTVTFAGLTSNAVAAHIHHTFEPY